jgi:hypothetical protein
MDVLGDWQPLTRTTDDDRLSDAWEGDGLTLAGSPRLRWEQQVDEAIAAVQVEMAADPARRAARVAAGRAADDLTIDELAYAIDRGRLRAPDSPLSMAGRFAHGEHPEPSSIQIRPIVRPPWRRHR